MLLFPHTACFDEQCISPQVGRCSALLRGGRPLGWLPLFEIFCLLPVFLFVCEVMSAFQPRARSSTSSGSGESARLPVRP